MSFQDKANEMIGETVVGITVEDNNESLIIHLENKKIMSFWCDADCCSDTWIEHFESPTQPEKIVSFEEVEITGYERSETKIRDDALMDVVQYYFYKLTTDKGTYMIELRNNSNGYYGGSLQ